MAWTELISFPLASYLDRRLDAAAVVKVRRRGDRRDPFAVGDDLGNGQICPARLRLGAAISGSYRD